VINPICEVYGQVVCPSGDCQKPEKCSGTPEEDAGNITPINVKVTKKFQDKKVIVNVVTNSKYVVAQIEFPANVLQPGWTLAVRQPPPSVSSSKALRDDDDNCDSKKLDIKTPVFELKVFNQDGSSVDKFSPPLRLSSFAQISASELKNRKVCFGFIENYSESGRGSVWITLVVLI